MYSQKRKLCLYRADSILDLPTKKDITARLSPPTRKLSVRHRRKHGLSIFKVFDSGSLTSNPSTCLSRDVWRQVQPREEKNCGDWAKVSCSTVCCDWLMRCQPVEFQTLKRAFRSGFLPSKRVFELQSAKKFCRSFSWSRTHDRPKCLLLRFLRNSQGYMKLGKLLAAVSSWKKWTVRSEILPHVRTPFFHMQASSNWQLWYEKTYVVRQRSCIKDCINV